METVLYIIGGYLIYGLIQIIVFKMKEAKFESEMQQTHATHSCISQKA